MTSSLVTQKKEKNSKDIKNSKRHKIGLWAFLLFSIGGGGFIIRGTIGQWTEWGDNTLLLYMVATLIYVVPFVLMIFEFTSLKKLQKAESGYQTWLNLIIGRKFGFMGGFFYFFVNIFYFLAIIPNIVNYAVYMILGNSATNIIDTLNENLWWKPVISIISIIVFWIATYVSAKGPKWLTRIGSSAGFIGMLFTMIFVVGALTLIARGSSIQYDEKDVTLHAFSRFDISWDKLGSMSWALQSLGGLEALAAYKNNLKNGQKTFKLGLWLNVAIFSTIMFTCSILIQAIMPESAGKDLGLLSASYVVFQQMGMPFWWTNILAFAFLFTTLAGSLMIWTAAPAKILFTDAPKGIFGKKISKVSSEGTPVNGLIAQGIIVTILFVLQGIGGMSSGMNLFLKGIQNLNAGAATIPVLFMLWAYIKMVWMHDHPHFQRDYKISNNKCVWLKRGIPLLVITPMLIIFLIATLTSLVPGPESWSGDLKAPIMQVVLGPIGIALAFLYTHIIFQKWRKQNPNDHSLFNELGK